MTMATWNKKRPAAAPETPTPAQASPPAVASETSTAQQPDTNRAAREEAGTQAALDEALALRQQTLAALAGGKDVHGELDQLDAEIDQLTRKLKRFEEARTLAAARNSKAGKVQAFEATRATIQSAVNDARTLIKEQAEIAAALVAINARVKAAKQAQAFIGARFDAAVREAGGPRIDEKRDALEKLIEQLVPAEFVSVPATPSPQLVDGHLLKLARDTLAKMLPAGYTPPDKKAA